MKLPRPPCEHDTVETLPCPHFRCPQGVPAPFLALARPGHVEPLILERVGTRWTDGIDAWDWAPPGAKQEVVLGFLEGIIPVNR